VQGSVNTGSARVADPRTLSFGAGAGGEAARTCAKEKILGEASPPRTPRQGLWRSPGVAGIRPKPDAPRDKI